jgi:hypothetical protein
MADQRLPEKSEKITATPDLEVHVVDPNDPTQHPTGSSFRMKLSNLLNLGTNTLLGLVDVLITTYGGNGGKILRINLAETGIEAIDNVFLNLTDVSESTYTNFDNYVVSVVPGGGLQFTPKTIISLTDVTATYLDERNEGNVAMVIKNKVTGVYSVNFKPVPTFEDLFGGSAIIRGGLTYRGFGLNYTIWGERYIINGRLIEINVSGEVTNDPGDNQFDRFDVYYIETDNQSPENVTVGILKGTPEEDPIIPTLDLSTQVQVSVRLIKKDEATDPNAITNIIYDENQAPPFEWLNISLPSGGNLNYTNDPKVGSKSIFLPQIASNGVLSFQRDTFFTYLANDFLTFYIKPIGFLAPQADFQFKLINSDNGNYWSLLLGREGLRNYGLEVNSNDWQLIQIQLSEFSSTSRDETLFDTFEITFNGTPELQLDWFVIQSNVPNPVTDVSTLDSVTNKGNVTENDIYIGKAFSTKSNYEDIELAAENVLIPKSYLNEELKEIKETPSGLVLFDLKGSELWLSVDGIMPTRVDLATLSNILGTGLLNVSLGTPNTDATLPAYRSGKTGFGSETNPQEDIDLVGSSKMEYTYANGVISRVALGGEEIASEIGYPTGSIKGQFLSISPKSGTQEATDGMVATFLQADLSAIGQANLLAQFGLQRNDNTRYANLIARKNNTNDGYQIGIQFFNNSKDERGWVRAYELGEGSGFDQEPLVESSIDMGAAGDYSRVFASPHLYGVDVSLITFNRYKDGSRSEGFVNGDSVAKTGTAATVLKAPKYALNIDEDGNMVTTPKILAEYADNAAATAAGLPLGTQYRTGDLVKVVH